MNATLRWIVALLVAVVAATPARADGKFYLGLGGAGSTYGSHCADLEDLGFEGRCDDNGSSRKLFVGYQLRPRLGVEASVNDFGASSFSGELDGLPVGGRVEASGATLAGVANVRLGERTSLLFKLGACSWDLESRAEIVGTPLIASARASGISPQFGLGVSYRASERVELRFEVEGVSGVGERDTTGRDDLSFGTLAILWRF